MSLLFRVVAFGEPRGPWRSKESQARLDAIAQGLGERDEDGEFYLEAGADIAWIRQDELRKRA